MRRFLSSSLGRLRVFAQREIVLLLVLGTVTASLWLFVVITEEVMEQEHHSLDNRVLLAFRNPDDPATLIGPGWLKPASLDISALGSTTVLTLFTVIVCGYLFLERRFRAAVMILFAALSGTVLNQVLKGLVDRERPQIVPHFAEISNSSFPSGHSMLSAIIYLTLAVLLTKTVETRLTKFYLIGSAFLLAFLIGVSRIVIGVHYPSDVLAGWTAGTAWAIICWLGATWLNRRKESKSR